MFAQRWRGVEAVDSLALLGAQARDRIRAVRQAGLKRTRVEFALLAEADDESEAQA